MSQVGSLSASEITPEYRNAPGWWKGLRSLGARRPSGVSAERGASARAAPGTGL